MFAQADGKFDFEPDPRICPNQNKGLKCAYTFSSASEVTVWKCTKVSLVLAYVMSNA